MDLEIGFTTEDWAFETMRNAALRFPALVAETPLRTHTILAKYTALRSYLPRPFRQTKLIAASEAWGGFGKPANLPPPPQEAEYTPFISKESAKSSDIGDATPELPRPADSTTRNNDEAGSKSDQKQQPPEERPYSWKPIQLTQEYLPTIQGVEDARSMVRTILIRIMQEINILTKFPDAAMDEQRAQPHISPFLFKGFLPVGEPIKKEASEENELDPFERQMASMKASGGRQGF
ncbi:hypothetical protein EKO27_g4557 [Xylaria grammica]|uniref:Uncharacterized protein n=1 Tax=Xylaria grammica TaxID=363999 RepID=A0A439D823_9PEZI|nr:hypothetical protein EKO27_g4557 [Xylaria grammica]